MIERTALKRLWPNASPVLIASVASQAPAVFQKHGINTPLRVAHFMAQISHESDGGRITEESLNYTTAERIAAVWPSRFTVQTAQAFTHNPRKLANQVYNGRMGNRAGSDDGYNYRGRGLLQITGRDSYRKLGQLTGLPLENEPGLAFDPDHALEVAAAEFAMLGCLPFCDRDDVRGVTRRVNGGFIGLDSRKHWLAKWKLAIPALPGALPPTPQGIAELEAPLPRTADVAPPTSMAVSNIGNGAVAGGGLGTAALAATVWDKFKELPDSMMQALIAAAGKPVFWICLATVGVAGFIWWKRYRLKQDAGV